MTLHTETTASELLRLLFFSLGRIPASHNLSHFKTQKERKLKDFFEVFIFLTSISKPLTSDTMQPSKTAN